MFYIALILGFIVAYLLGSINSSIIVGKIFAGDDIRKHGSGSAGATNVLRIYGKKAAVFATLGDILKAVIAILMAKVISMWAMPMDGSLFIYYFAGIGVVLGHNFPVYFKFKGGKGVWVSAVVLLFADWRIGLIALVFALIIMAATRYVSLGSMLGALAVVVLAFFMRPGDWWYIGFVTILAILIIIMHRGNIVRLLLGTENKLGKKS